MTRVAKRFLGWLPHAMEPARQDEPDRLIAAWGSPDGRDPLRPWPRIDRLGATLLFLA
jgi:hypothetical protein